MITDTRHGSDKINKYSHTPIYCALWGKRKMHGIMGETVNRVIVDIYLHIQLALGVKE